MSALQLLLPALLFLFFVLSAAMPQNYQPVQQPAYKEPALPYNFAYNVRDDYSGLDYGHNENSDGSVVTGEYRVLLPDGRTQVVR